MKSDWFISVKEALLRTMGDVEETHIPGYGSENDYMAIDLETAHQLIATSSLNYLNFATFSNITTLTSFVSAESFALSLQDSFLFLNYASVFWYLHVSETKAPNPNIIASVQKFLESNNCFTWLECYSTFAALAPGKFGHHFQVQSKLRSWVENSKVVIVPGLQSTVENYLVRSIKDTISLSTNAFGTNDLRTIAILSRLGSLYCFQDNHEEAKKIRLAIVNGYEGVLGDRDDRTRRAFTDLGYVQYMLDNLDEAEELFYKALGGQNESEWRHDDVGLETMKELATVYWLQKRLREAQRVMLLALEGLIERFTDKHRLTVLCRHYLAAIYADQGNITEAISIATANQLISVEIQGADHPDTLRGEQFIADLHAKVGNYIEAESLLQKVLSEQTQVLGPTHADTHWTRGRLGQLFAKSGRQREAEVAYINALQGTTSIFGESHSQSRSIATLLTTLLRETGREKEARDIEERYRTATPNAQTINLNIHEGQEILLEEDQALVSPAQEGKGYINHDYEV
jgi:tetratricopeptide (TPR) repeat protein